jgi:L-amino acid N-acyltransferase YncA
VRHLERGGTVPVEWHVASATSLPFPDASFDAIVCVQVLCYVKEPAVALREMARVLRDHGRILVLDTDWRARLLATSNEERMARVLSAMDRTVGFADMHLPPKLPSLALSAGLRPTQARGFSLLRVGSFEPGSYFDVGAWGCEAEDVSNADVEAFLHEQRCLSETGAFFFSCPRTLLLLCHAPPARSALTCAKLPALPHEAPRKWPAGTESVGVVSAVEGERAGAASAAGVSIRVATARDCQSIVDIWNWYIRETALTFTSDLKSVSTLEQTMVSKAAAAEPFLCAVLDDVVVGFATYGSFRSGPGYKHTVEHSLYVSRACCGCGIGKALLSALETYASAAGVRVIVGGISSVNERALAFYTRMGYEQAGRMADVGRKFEQWLALVLMQRVLTSPVAQASCE